MPKVNVNETTMVKDLIALWLYKHGWESPEWGDRFKLMAMAEVAGTLKDKATGKQIKSLAKKAIR